MGNPGSIVILPSGRVGILPGGRVAVFGPDGSCPECCGGGAGGGPCECSVDGGAGVGSVGLAPVAEGLPWGVTVAASVRIERRMRATWEGITVCDAQADRTYGLGVELREEPGCRILTLTDLGQAQGPSFTVPNPAWEGTITGDLGRDIVGSARTLAPARGRQLLLEVLEGRGPVLSNAVGVLRRDVVGNVPAVQPGRGGRLALEVAVDPWPSVRFAPRNVEYTPMQFFGVRAEANLLGGLRADGVAPAGYVQLEGEAVRADPNPFFPWEQATLTHQGGGGYTAGVGQHAFTWDYSVRFVGRWRGPYGVSGFPTTRGDMDVTVRMVGSLTVGLRQCQSGARAGEGFPDDPRAVAAAEASLRRCRGCGE